MGSGVGSAQQTASLRSAAVRARRPPPAYQSGNGAPLPLPKGHAAAAWVTVQQRTGSLRSARRACTVTQAAAALRAQRSRPRCAPARSFYRLRAPLPHPRQGAADGGARCTATLRFAGARCPHLPTALPSDNGAPLPLPSAGGGRWGRALHRYATLRGRALPPSVARPAIGQLCSAPPP